MTLGIYILSYNRRDDIGVVLDKLIALEDFNEIIELIVLDQCSTDGTDRFIQNMYPSVKLIKAEKNLGVAGGRDKLFRVSKADICIFLDDDSFFNSSGSLVKIANIFRQNDNLDFLSFNVRSIKGDLRDWPHPRTLKAKHDKRWKCQNFVGCGHAIRRSSYFLTDGYSVNDEFYAEELELCWKFYSLRGHLSGLYVGDILITHLASEKSRLYWSDKRLYFRVRNRLKYYIENFSLWSPLSYIFISGYVVSDLIIAAKYRNFGAFVTGIRDIKYRHTGRIKLFQSLNYQLITMKRILLG